MEQTVATLVDRGIPPRVAFELVNPLKSIGD